MQKQLRDLKPGDVIDILPVLERVGLYDPSLPYEDQDGVCLSLASEYPVVQADPVLETPQCVELHTECMAWGVARRRSGNGTG